MRPLEVRAAIQGHDEDPLSQKRSRTRPHEALGRRRDLVGVEPAVAAHLSVGVVVGHDIANRPVALGLYDQTTLELQAGPDQGGQGAGLAQQGRDRLGVVMRGQDGVDGLAQTNQAATHGPAFDLEGGGQVVTDGRNGGVGRVIGHGGSLDNDG